MKSIPIAICCLVLVVALVGCSHDHESFYPTRSDAERKGEFERRWLPDFLPKSSHAIHLAYDLSPSREWCEFRFDGVDAETLLKSLTTTLPIMEIPSPRVQWWPKVLEGSLNPLAIQRAGFELYSVTRPVSQAENETMIFAIDRKEGHGYFYGY